jgi:hypothetical protein
MAKGRKQVELASFKEFDPDELKDSAREMLLSMDAFGARTVH